MNETRISQMSRTLPFGALTVHRVVSIFAALGERVGEWHRARRTLHELERLTPAQLDDIGLTRADIERLEGRTLF